MPDDGAALSEQEIPLIAQARGYGTRTAIVASEGVFTYAQLLEHSHAVAASLLDGASDLKEANVAFLTSAGFTHVAVQWGIWRAGGTAVPLPVSATRPELEHMVNDSGASLVVSEAPFETVLQPIAESAGARLLTTTHAFEHPPHPLPDIDLDRRAMILYTSGTTSKPKGVVSTHRNIQAQVTSLVDAWKWSPKDHILHVLPLHHVHGIINVLTCALWSGATCEIMPKFDANAVWDRFLEGGLTLFMAVPTIYSRLIAAWETASTDRQQAMIVAAGKQRLMVSGSAALPVQTLERWHSISRHVLLERYGMTEIGMALSNPLHGDRRPGFVGAPLPGVEIRLVNEAGDEAEPGTSGEIFVRGPAVFHEYWNNTEATAAAFSDGWFQTGDVAQLEDGAYRILGRKSVDIIKTGGFKVSALEVEAVLLDHPDIAECAVIGADDPEWGERVCATVVLGSTASLSLTALRDWARERLSPHKIPSRLVCVEKLPRNAMGKVTKPALTTWFQAEKEAPPTVDEPTSV